MKENGGAVDEGGLMKRHPFVLVFLVTTFAACTSHHRPPALAGAAGGNGGGSGDRAASSRATQRLDPGQDVQVLRDDSTSAQDFPLSEPSGEGGPLADIHFDYDRAVLTDEARAALEKHALWLQSHREAKVTVEGHCDERGTTEYNLALGEQRARAAQEYLVSLGVAGARLRTVSYGKERLLDTTGTEQARAKNRRAHFAVSR